jgi:hypothetical protein
MNPTALPNVLFYPFHLCHHETLSRLLARFHAVHFRDFMAWQLTPFVGLTAFPDRMGDSYPELVHSGRLVQGYNVSGPLPADMETLVDRDLGDREWRSLFHDCSRRDLRFRRALFQQDAEQICADARLMRRDYSLRALRNMSSRAGPDVSKLEIDYGMALAKTAAALAYTTRLARSHGLQTATDSAGHFALYERSCQREGITVHNHLILRIGY